MPPHTDALLQRFGAELDERTTFIDSLVEQAERDQRDLTDDEVGLVTRTRERIETLSRQIDPLQDAARIARDSRERTRQLSEEIGRTRNPDTPAAEYRSAGAFVLDFWRAGLGVEEAVQRIDVFKRAAAHQTTGDNPGLLPEQLLGPVINFVDQSRPLVSALGPRQLPAGSWSRPRITQHTNVAKQTAEKQELVSRKLVIGKLPVTADTYGGYVNISRQDVDWSQPAIMDIVIADLAGVYSEQTEAAAADVFTAAATAGPAIPTGPATAQGVSAAIWTAAGSVFAATKGAGRLILAVAPDMLGMVGPLFAPISPQNAQSTGFQAGSFGSGAVGAISGITVVMSPGLDAGTILVMSSAAAEVYEDRIGALQVVEPSVLGVQVAYAGYFAPLTIEAGGIVSISKTA